MKKLKPKTVYLIGVPIGNIKDITYRALEAIKDVDILLCEDTRETERLLMDFLIKKEMYSYIGSRDKALKKSVEVLNKYGTIGIVSDRGMPCVSDPGADLVNVFRSLKYDVDIVPGVSSVTTAFALTGLAGGFYFVGFLPRSEKNILEMLHDLLLLKTNLVFFESSVRIKRTLKVFAKIIDYKIYILRELTKTYQEILYGSPDELLEKNIQGEIVIIVGHVNG